MKYLNKIVLSVVVIGLFVGYSFYQRMHPANAIAFGKMMPTTSMLRPPKMYKDGSYTGPVTNAFYGNVQVEVVIKNHQLSQVSFLDQPHDNTYSKTVNGMAVPSLIQEALHVQSSKVQVVTGATQTSGAFIKSLAAALAKS